MTDSFKLKLYVTKDAHEYATQTSRGSRQIAFQCEDVMMGRKLLKGADLIIASCFELHLGDTTVFWSGHQITPQQRESFDGLYDLLSRFLRQRAEFSVRILGVAP